MANFALPATGSGASGKSASTVLLANGSDVQNVQVGAATEGGAFTPVAIATQATLAAVLAALGSPTLPTGAATEATVASVLAKLNASIVVSGPLTDAQLRASAVPVSVVSNIAQVTDGSGFQHQEVVTEYLVAGVPQAVDAAHPLPVSGTVVTGSLTDAQLRATPVPVTGGSAPADITGTQVFSGTGTLTLSGLNGMSTLVIEIPTNTATGVTTTLQGTLDGTNWETLATTANATNTYTQSSFGSTAGFYMAQIAGYSSVRVNVSAFGTNSFTVNMRASAGATNSRTVTVSSPLPALAAGAAVIGALTANQSVNNAQVSGTAIDVSNGAVSAGTQRVTVASDSTGQTKIIGGSTAVVKPASTAPAATDPSLVVTISPNSPATKVDGSAVTQPVSAASLPLPAGAATAAKQPALGTAGSASADVLSVQGIASMTALKVDGSAVTQPVSNASLPLPAGASTAAKQPALGTAGSAAADVLSVQGVASMTALKVDGSAVTQPVSGTVTTTPPANASENLAQVAGTTTAVDSGSTSAGTLRVVNAGAATGTLSNVAASASSVTVLASNTARRGATVWNDSTSILYLKFGTTASATSCTVKLVADAYYEVPNGYNGKIDGIWVSATGSARVTEIS